MTAMAIVSANLLLLTVAVCISTPGATPGSYARNIGSAYSY